jgi:hypothetical protein
MSFWDDDEKVVTHKLRGRGKPPRRNFGIVKYTGEMARLIVPQTVSAQVGQRVRYKLVEGGIAFRIADEGEFSLYRPTRRSKSLAATLPEELSRFATNKLTDIVTTPFHGGWFVPLDQFEKKKGA